MTLLELITDAYRMGGIISEVATPSAEQGQKAVKRLNDMMAAMAADGIDFGYSPKSSTTDTVVFPAEIIGGIKALLAVTLCSEIGLDPPATTVGMAENSYERMLRQAVLLQNTPVRMTHMSLGQGQGLDYDILRQ